MTEDNQFLYRYRHLNGEHREWTKKIITDSLIHFANPTTFNDPFDCKVHFQPSFSTEELKQKYLGLIKKRMPALNRKGRRTKASSDIKAMKPDKFISKITAGFQDSIDNVGVLSLSASDRNILLWSHYAAGHTGLCLKFIATKYTPFFGRALPVTYTGAYPDINVLDKTDKHLNAFLLTKAEDWSYEEEWRIIDFDDGAGDKIFPTDLLVGVILGAKMPLDDKRAVAEWVRERDCQTELLEASVASGSFSIEIRAYEG